MLNTYITPGLLGFKLVIRIGQAWLEVDFKGGRASGYGDYCATFSTADPSLQLLIESSPEFQNGRILLQP